MGAMLQLLTYKLGNKVTCVDNGHGLGGWENVSHITFVGLFETLLVAAFEQASQETMTFVYGMPC